MAETAPITTSSPGRDATKAGPVPPANGLSVEAQTAPTVRAPSRPQMNQIYALPAPIRTFPLPTFYPNNPISLLHLAYAWLRQVFRPPPREPSVVHTGVWDPETRSVHVKDEASIRALWEQGFYGKGSLSRSEPNWLKRELARRGSPEGKTVSEARTELRREERRLAKWERAKAELEAIEKQRLAEAAAHAAADAIKTNGDLSAAVDGLATLALSEGVKDSAPEDSLEDVVSEPTPAVEVARAPKLNGTLKAPVKEFNAPVGPAELLALPNSISSLPPAKPNGVFKFTSNRKPPVGPAELLLLPNSLADLVSEDVTRAILPEFGALALSHPTLQAMAATGANISGHAAEASASAGDNQVGETTGNDVEPNGINNKRSPPLAEEGHGPPPMKRRKSVRFSPTVESTTFLDSDPPSPSRSTLGSKEAPALTNGKAVELSPPAVPAITPTVSGQSLETPVDAAEIENKERFQLAPEEAFFLTFSLGALKVVDLVTSSPISTEQLLSLFRSHSYFPPRADLRPDDSFLVNYVVYHHFRSLGWVPRHGIKFGVDWILYQRGPVFDHSEFGIMVMPSYSDPAWEGEEHSEPKRTWSWLMGVNRVLSHVLKSLVLVYVDIPTPEVFDKEMRRGGIAAALKKYTIREVMVRRFSVNRNR
ncbi:tRNA splicing endonuclease subunit sen2 [Collariella sp. IMI 366227]|nr:tRNA splicing endonuclease subunit sen2 [Collariella sp. IMI 366227]